MNRDRSASHAAGGHRPDEVPPGHDMDTVDPIADFWAATALEPWNVAAFWARLARPATPGPIIPPLVGGGAGEPLPTVNDRFQRRLADRRSGRDFSDAPLGRDALARVLAAAGVDGCGRRVFPRAGDFDSIHVFVLARRIERCTRGSAWRYDHRSHALAPVGGPIDPELFATMCSLGDDDPAAVLVFVIEPSRTIDRYGVHGQRFGLQEVGHAMQNVLLRMSDDDLTGYPMGGLVDALVLDALGLGGMNVQVGGGLAVGHRAGHTPTRRLRHPRRSRRSVD